MLNNFVLELRLKVGSRPIWKKRPANPIVIEHNNHFELMPACLGLACIRKQHLPFHDVDICFMFSHKFLEVRDSRCVMVFLLAYNILYTNKNICHSICILKNINANLNNTTTKNVHQNMYMHTQKFIPTKLNAYQVVS